MDVIDFVSISGSVICFAWSDEQEHSKANDKHIMLASVTAPPLKTFSFYQLSPESFSIDSLRRSMKMKGNSIDTEDLWR